MTDPIAEDSLIQMFVPLGAALGGTTYTVVRNATTANAEAE